MINKDKITIAILNYNRHEYLSELIDSLDKQSYKKIKILIIDDCSRNPETIGYINYLENTRKDIKIIKKNKNLGVGDSCKIAFEKCETELLMISGNDDIFYNNTIERIVNKFEENDNLSVVCGAVSRFHKNIEDSYYIDRVYAKDTYFKGGAEALENFWYSSGFLSGITYRKKTISEFPDNNIETHFIRPIAFSMNKYDYCYLSNPIVYGRNDNTNLGIKILASHNPMEDYVNLANEVIIGTKFEYLLPIIKKKLSYMYILDLINYKQYFGFNRFLKEAKYLYKNNNNIIYNIKFITISLFCIFCPSYLIKYIKNIYFTIKS